MKRICWGMMLAVCCQATIAGSIVGNWQCSIGGTIALTTNGVRKVSRYNSTALYTFYPDGSYASVNAQPGSPLVYGVWFQNGRRFSIYPDVNELANLVVSACGNTPSGYAFGCSVNNVTAYLNGNANGSFTRLSATGQQTQNVIYNYPYTNTSLFGKFTYSCVPG